MSAPTEPWAMVPERVAYLGLDATALDVLIILSSKGGRSREAWITQKTMGERLKKHRTTIGRTIKRLEREGLVRDTGNRVPVGDPPVWVKKYEVAPFPASDLREVRPRRTSGDHEVLLDDNQVRLGTDEVRSAHTEVRPRRTQSIASKAVPLNTNSKARISKNGNADVRDTEEAKPKPAAKTKPPKPETPEDWERARAKTKDPAFLALVAEEEARKAVSES